MVLGSECVMITNPRDLKSFIKTMSKRPVSFFVGINTLFNALLHHPDISKVDFSKMKFTVSGGMATQKTVAEHWQKVTGVTILEGYGLTEASPVVTLNPLNLKHFSGSSGVPVPATDMSIRDANGNEVALGKEGELWLKGPQVMKGYWNMPDETKLVIDENGWLRTGDVVRMDERGFIYIVDRLKDMILVSGFNVFPAEIEDVIMMHEGVQEVAVIGVPNDRSGETIKAFIVKENDSLSEGELISYCRKNLTGYKVPKIIEFRHDLPKSNVGKVLRRELREQELQTVSIAAA